jgi:hypothetical protein
LVCIDNTADKHWQAGYLSAVSLSIGNKRFAKQKHSRFFFTKTAVLSIFTEISY